MATSSDFDAAVVRAMRFLGKQERTVFVGQSVWYDGARIYTTLDGVPMVKRREHPVIEDHQLGYCTGLALGGLVPICIYPRIDFMLLAMNQLVNHLDKAPLLWGVAPKVIIRAAVGRKTPLDAGPQHTQNHTLPFRLMLTTVYVQEVRAAEEVEPAYLDAWDREGSTLIVENQLG